MLQKSLLVIISICVQAFAVNLVLDRNNTDVELLKGGKATNVSYGYYLQNFQKTSMKAFEDIDLSLYPSKKLLIGYGVYDVNDNNCRYLDIPSNSDIDVNFENLTVLGNKTYAVSRTKITSSECKALTAQYSGYVYTPKNASEYKAVLNGINQRSKGGIAHDLWVGYTRTDCDSQYLNDEGFSQQFTKFIYKNEICTPYNLYTYSPADSQLWLRTGSSDLHYCAIEIQSPDYLRPVKYCAPWWRVERSWKLISNDSQMKINGKDYDFRYLKYLMDYPKDFITCTKYDENISLPSNNYTYTCNSYDDIKASAACIASITLPQCHVNECVGYVENVCTKIDSFEPFKNYDVGYIIQDGVETRVKVKDNKITNVYDCPPPKPNSSSCVEKSSVTVLPVECPGSQCVELSTCLQSDLNTSDDCFDTFRCEKSYGSVDSPHINSDGTVDGFNGICIDGNTSTTVLAYIEKKSSIDRQCIEFEKFYDTNTTIKNCTSSSVPTQYTVSTSITRDDIYQDDPRCIRTNNVAEARPTTEEVISYSTKGFFKTSIERAFIDGTSLNNELNSTSYLLAASSLVMDNTNATFNTSTPASDPIEVFCASTFPTQWMNNRFVPLGDASLKGFVYNKSGTATRNLEIFSSSPLTTPATVSDSFGQVYSAVGWSVAVLDENYKIISFETFGSDGSLLNSFLSSLVSGTIVAIITHGDPSAGVSDNASLITTMTEFGATDTIIQGLLPTGAYALVGTKGVGRIFEQASNNITSSYVAKLLSFSISIPPVLAISTIANCTANKATLSMIDTVPSYQDYDFSSIGISQSDVENQNFCFIGGGTTGGDSYVSSIENNDALEFIYNIEPSLSSNCEDYSKCLGGENISANGCKISVTQLSSSVSIEPQIEAITPSEYVITKTEGSFLSDFSYKDVYAIQEYTDGTFGYISNYLFKLPENNIVKIDNKEVSPIIQQTPIPYKVSYDNSSVENAQKTKNESAISQEGFHVGSVPILTAFGNFPDPALQAVLIGAVPLLPLFMILSKENKWGWYNNSFKLYQKIDTGFKYFENLYGYDPRLSNGTELLWMEEETKSRTMEWNTASRYKSNFILAKDTDFLNYGFIENQVAGVMKNSVEKTSIRIDKDGALETGGRWWELNYRVSYTQSGSVADLELTKPINTIYMGAVNMLSIVVPFTGDYEVIAYDKNNNILGSIVAQEQNFVENTTAASGNIAQYYAKVQLALSDNFNLSSGQNGSNGNGSCLASDFVEWGGGTSGAYYEQGVPDLGAGNNDCFKSNDAYVLEHSAVKVTVRPVNETSAYVIQLKKPMPFPNRIILVNLKKIENRKYECYDQLIPCSVEN